MTGFVVRAPWYVRERQEIGLRHPAARRPALQMYDTPEFARRIVADPRQSLAFGEDDVWSYPIPVDPTKATGRARLSPWQFISTDLRKLYQPNHDRFYTVVAEAFCDAPGLPRAGSHTDLEMRFVMRRRITTVAGAKGPRRRLARDLIVQLAKDKELAVDEQRVHAHRPPRSSDERDLWWADQAWRRRFAEDHRESLAELTITTETEGWFVAADGTGSWKPVEAATGAGTEESFPMWRLPARPDECDAARTRSTWFGLVPTYSGQHYLAPGRGSRPPAPAPKYDDHAIYEVHCFVRRKPARGKEHFPPEVWWNESPSEPFRLAAPMDPQGTGKRLTSITLPDLRRLAARAGRPMGPGGVAITTPPDSQLVFNPFGDIPKSGTGAIGAGGSVCTFALELFFIVAFFLFLMFMPIVVFAFQLWWMLALRFCIPPSIGLSIAADVLADVSLDVSAGVGAGLEARLDVDARLTAQGITGREAIDQIFGTDSTAFDDPADTGVWLDALADAVHDDDGDPATPDVAVFDEDRLLFQAAVAATDPAGALRPEPPVLEEVPEDPLCRRQ